MANCELCGRVMLSRDRGMRICTPCGVRFPKSDPLKQAIVARYRKEGMTPMEQIHRAASEALADYRMSEMMDALRFIVEMSK